MRHSGTNRHEVEIFVEKSSVVSNDGSGAGKSHISPSASSLLEAVTVEIESTAVAALPKSTKRD
jgi:hypothetical protein